MTGDRIPPRPVVRRHTPQGEAAIQLIVEPQEIKPGETLTLRLVNLGEVVLLTGLAFYVQRRAGKEWVAVPWPKNSFFPLVGIPLPPGGSTKPERWPIDGVDAQPGLYRVVKSARYEDPNHVRPDVLLTAHARFRVRTGDMVARIPWSTSFFGADRRSTAGLRPVRRASNSELCSDWEWASDHLLGLFAASLPAPECDNVGDMQLLAPVGCDDR